MTLDEASQIYESIRASRWKDLADELARCAIRYAEIRVAWSLASSDDRMDMGDTRTRAHNAFIDACNILSRNMHAAGEDNSWRSTIGNDRKAIGDFACLLHCTLALQAR